MNQDEILQYAIYALWVALILLVIIIINRKVKQRIAARNALRNPEVRLYSYELQKASGKITFFFEADEPIAYSFYIVSEDNSIKHEVAAGITKRGGQKLQFETNILPNGVYYYVITTDFQKIDKRLIIQN